MSQEISVCLDIIRQLSEEFMERRRRPILVVLDPVRICGNSQASLWAIGTREGKTYITVGNLLIWVLQRLARRGYYERDLWNTVEYVFLPCMLFSEAVSS